MSQSSTHALSTRLFIQAAITGLLALTSARSSMWLVLTLAVAAGAVAVALLLRSAPANAKRVVVGFEGLALFVGGLGLATGHYIPGTIFGVITLITALNMPHGVTAAASMGSQWVPPPAGAQPAPAYGAPAYAPPVAAPAFAAPVMDNPYAPPAPFAAPAMGTPYAPQVPVAPMASVTFAPPASEQPAPVEAPAPVSMRPDDIPPAPRAMTILPGK